MMFSHRQSKAVARELLFSSGQSTRDVLHERNDSASVVFFNRPIPAGVKNVMALREIESCVFLSKRSD